MIASFYPSRGGGAFGRGSLGHEASGHERRRARGVLALVSGAFASGLLLLATSALAQVPYDGTQDLRPTFMGTAYDIEGGAYDGKRGYLFRIWNRSGEAVSLDTLPDRFDGEVLGFLSDGASYSDGTASYPDSPERGDALFEAGPEVLAPSPTGAFSDRPANVIVVVEPEVERLVWTLRRRTATAALSASERETLELGETRDEPDPPDDLPPDPGEAGKATLLGIDSNNNGVRDDVEITLARIYADEPDVRQYLYQVARRQAGLVDIGANGTREQAVEFLNSREFGLASHCLVYHRFTHDLPMGWASDRSRETRVYMLNTPERVAAYDAFDDLLKGGVTFGNDTIVNEDCEALAGRAR